MMATTHALAGVVLAVLVGGLFPESAAGTSVLPIAAAALGGLFPDFDLYAGHRRTLHFPVYFSGAAAVAVAVAAVVPAVVPTAGTVAVAVAFFLAAAALHSVMDALGGGLELKPWLGTSERAVYSHYHGRWIRPRRWVRYDGAPEDLLVAVAFAVPTVYAVDGVVETGVVVALGVSAVYVLLRKPMVYVTQTLVDLLPADFVDRLPARFVEDFR
ncbi:MAG: metal-dependent hydrolase [Haloquadratum sp.]